MEDIKYWVALNRVPQLGTVRFRRLEAYFGELKEAWNAGRSELKAAGIDDRPARELVAARDRISPDAEMASLGAGRGKRPQLAPSGLPGAAEGDRRPSARPVLQRCSPPLRRKGDGGGGNS